jgi:hypothetical protein
MFDVDDGGGRYRDPFSRHLNLEPLTLLYAIGKSPQFLDELFYGVAFLDVTLVLFVLCFHIAVSFTYYDLVISGAALHE